MIYSTCSLEPEENDAQVEAFLSDNLNWILEPPPEGTVAPELLDGGRLRILPHRQGTDGAFAETRHDLLVRFRDSHDLNRIVFEIVGKKSGRVSMDQARDTNSQRFFCGGSRARYNLGGRPSQNPFAPPASFRSRSIRSSRT